MTPRIGLTLGDPAGIGAEVVLKSLRLVNTKYVPLIIGSAGLVERAGQMIGHTVQAKTVKSFGDISGEVNTLSGISCKLILIQTYCTSSYYMCVGRC